VQLLKVISEKYSLMKTWYVFANKILVFKWYIVLPVIKKLVTFRLLDTHYNQITYKAAFGYVFDINRTVYHDMFL
jgi:hypothetical protein